MTCYFSVYHISLILISISKTNFNFSVRLIISKISINYISIFFSKYTLAFPWIQMKLSFIALILLFKAFWIIYDRSISMHFSLKEFTSIRFTVRPIFYTKTCYFSIIKFSFVLSNMIWSFSYSESWLLPWLCLFDSMLPKPLILKAQVIILVIICALTMPLFCNGINLSYISIFLINHF